MKFLKGNDRDQLELFSLNQRFLKKTAMRFYYIITKKSTKCASADVGFTFTYYNLRQIMNLVDTNQLEKNLKKICALLFDFQKLFQSVLRPFIVGF